MKLLQSQKPTPGTDEEQDMKRGYLGPCLITDRVFCLTVYTHFMVEEWYDN
jgi:hypothetical protein